MKKLFDLESVTAETLGGGRIVRIGELHRVVDVELATAVGNPDPAGSTGRSACPRPPSPREPPEPALDDGKAENPA
jgi:hypothetical protein